MYKSSFRFTATLSLLFALAFVFWHCRGSYVTDGQGVVIRGVVLDTSSDAPIDSAWISIRDTTGDAPDFFTDTSGYFQYPDFVGPEYYIYVGKTGYDTESKWVNTNSVPDTLYVRLTRQ